MSASTFGQIFTFGGVGACTDALLPLRTKFSVLEHTRGVRLPAKFRLDLFIMSPPSGEKPKFLPFFGLRHLVVSPIGSSLGKLNIHAQLQTSPYPIASKSFLYSNAFMAKSGALSLTFKSVTDRQTNRQTKKLNVFGHPGGG